ncbi:hypothetical protein DYB32_008352 [Aphanomyces invadans]|uniref:F-box domain-containing protein n=1 Tax=Aphanomyces invadans TaxID=157072 RepID=A0A418AL98_9STRA|nr:hypothetical protein DYB32_008352 [Aphanomyces invadans]
MEAPLVAMAFPKLEREGPPTAYMPHNSGDHPVLEQHRSINIKLEALRSLRRRVSVVPTNSFTTSLVFDRRHVDRSLYPSGGLARLGDMESLVLDFLGARDLVLNVSMVCRRWAMLYVQDSLWAKFMTTGVEGYPLRGLLALPSEASVIPNIQVYMMYCLSGLANGPLLGRALDSANVLQTRHYKDDDVIIADASVLDKLRVLETRSVSSIHVQRVQLSRERRIDLLMHVPDPVVEAIVVDDINKSCVSLHTWLQRNINGTASPPSTDVLRSILHQILHGLVALQAAGLTHDKVSMRTVIVHPLDESISLENGRFASDKSVETEESSDSMNRVPLVQVAGHAYLNHVLLSPNDPPVAAMDHHHASHAFQNDVVGAPTPLLDDTLFRNRFWTCMKKIRVGGRHRRIRRYLPGQEPDDEYAESAPTVHTAMLVMFMHCVLDMCFQGRWTAADGTPAPPVLNNVDVLAQPQVILDVNPTDAPRSLWQCIRRPVAAIPSDCRAMLQYAAHLVFTQAASMEPLLQHPFFQRRTLDTIVPVDAGNMVDNCTFMNLIHQWYAAELPQASPSHDLLTTTTVLKEKHPAATLMPSEAYTLRQLDVSQCVDLSSRTILSMLDMFGSVEELRVSKAMLREPTVDYMVASLAHSVLPKLRGIDSVFAKSLESLETSYATQLTILNDVLDQMHDTSVGS